MSLDTEYQYIRVLDFARSDAQDLGKGDDVQWILDRAKTYQQFLAGAALAPEPVTP